MDKIERLKKGLVRGYYEEIDIDIKELERIRIYDKLDELVIGYNKFKEQLNRHGLCICDEIVERKRLEKRLVKFISWT